MPADRNSPAGLLAQAVRSVFARWTGLQLAVAHGGSADAGALADALLADVTTLATSGVRRADVDDYLVVMDDAFERLGADLEDGSVEDVAALVVRMRDAAVAGDLAPAVAEIEKGNRPGAEGAAGGSRAVDGDGDGVMEEDSSGEEGEDSDVGEEAGTGGKVVSRKAPQAPVTDEDGFTTVTRRR